MQNHDLTFSILPGQSCDCSLCISNFRFSDRCLCSFQLRVMQSGHRLDLRLSPAFWLSSWLDQGASFLIEEQPLLRCQHAQHRVSFSATPCFSEICLSVGPWRRPRCGQFPSLLYPAPSAPSALPSRCLSSL